MVITKDPLFRGSTDRGNGTGRTVGLKSSNGDTRCLSLDGLPPDRCEEPFVTRKEGDVGGWVNVRVTGPQKFGRRTGTFLSTV